MNKPKEVSSGKRPAVQTKDKDPFTLPRTIAKQLKVCAQAHEEGTLFPQDTVKYLWINLADAPDSQGKAMKGLTWQDWLNVIDEAAALGIECVIICVGDSFARNPGLWRICRWAQEAHELDVGLHLYGSHVHESEAAELARLDPQHTWVFASDKDLNSVRHLLQKQGVHVISAGVGHEEHSPPCDMPESMVFVDTRGRMYTCGLVLNNEQFLLGHVAEKPLGRVLKDTAAPRAIPASVEHRAHGCDACPPLMARRMVTHA